MKPFKRINILFLAAIMCMAAACAKSDKESGKTENAKKEVQTASLKPEKTITKTHYQKKETYFSLPNRQGGKLDLANYAGKPVAVFFFAEYCHYCKKAAPFMKKIHKAYAEKGLAVLGISVDRPKSAADKFAVEHKLNFPIAYDGAEISQNYEIRGVPYIFALDKKHEIMDFWAGYDESYDSEIIETLDESMNL